MSIMELGALAEIVGAELQPTSSRRRCKRRYVPEGDVQTTGLRDPARDLSEANDRGYECLLVEDATESYYPAFKQATIEMVRSSDALIGWTATSDQVLDALDRL